MSNSTTENNGNNDSSAGNANEAVLTDIAPGAVDHGADHENTEQEEYEISIAEGEGENDHAKEQNRKNAERRLERRRQRELEERRAAVERGELPDELKAEYTPPAAPSFNDFFSDEALEKYDWDQNRANAAFQQAMIEWSAKTQEGKHNHSQEQAKRVESYRRQSQDAHDKLVKFYDSAEKLNLPDYAEKEDAFRKGGFDGWELQFQQYFPEKAAAMVYHLGANPSLMRELIDLQKQDPLAVTLRLGRLADKLTVKQKRRSDAPEPDNGLSGGSPGGNAIDTLQRQMQKALNAGDVDKYREIKHKLAEAQRKRG